jgi:hypothetical protein
MAKLAEVLKVDPFQLLLPTQDSPYFDRHRTLTSFRRQLEQVFEESMGTVFDSMMRPYGPMRGEDAPGSAENKRPESNKIPSESSES